MHKKFYEIINKSQILNYDYSVSMVNVEVKFNVLIKNNKKLNLCEIAANHNLPVNEIYFQNNYTVLKSESKIFGNNRFELFVGEDYKRFRAELIIPKDINEHGTKSLLCFLKDFF